MSKPQELWRSRKCVGCRCFFVVWIFDGSWATDDSRWECQRCEALRGCREVPAVQSRPARPPMPLPQPRPPAAFPSFGRCGRAWSLSRCRARARGLTWQIDVGLFHQLRAEPCAYCLMFFAAPTAGSGLDRLDNAAGYEPQNVVPCCPDCNVARMDRFSPEEMRAFIGPAIRAIKLKRGAKRLKNRLNESTRQPRLAAVQMA